MKLARSLAWLAIMTTFGISALAAETPTADSSKVSREITAEALEKLWVKSDTLQARIIRGLAAGKMDYFRALVPDDLGIVLPDGRNTTGTEVTQMYDSLIMERLGGTQVNTERVEHILAEDEGGWVKEKVRYEMTLPSNDSTGVIMRGHFVLFWQIADGKWSWKRLFVSTR